MGEETIFPSAEDVPSQQEFILREKVQLYNPVLRTYRLAEGHCRLMWR